MKITDLSGQNVCMIGYGREGQAVVRALQQHVPDCSVTIADMREELGDAPAGVSTQLGNEYLANLDRFDVVIKSPGVPPCPETDAVQDKLTNSTQIFLDTVMATGSLVIGVTGSKGKSTTSSLLYGILDAAGKDVHLVGNIGIPTLDFLDKAQPDTIFVQEMSSYQLMDVRTSPPIAIVTSIFPEHLDYHGSFDAYLEAKMHICWHQSKQDHVFYVTGDKDSRKIARRSIGTPHEYNDDMAPVAIEDTNLIGNHNLQNIAGAWQVAEFLGIDKTTAIAAIQAFEGLPHRLESLGVHHGIHWIDDAISTTPESAIVAIDSFGSELQTIILGGQDRGQRYRDLGLHIDTSSIKNVILFPDTGPTIKACISRADINFFEASSMEEAVAFAKEHTVEGGLCLLSTAAPSYNMFKNYEEKGDLFKKYILG